MAVIGKFLVEHHAGFKHHNISFNEEICETLPEDGIITGLSTYDDDENNDDVADEGNNRTHVLI